MQKYRINLYVDTPAGGLNVRLPTAAATPRSLLLKCKKYSHFRVRKLP